MAYRKNIDWIKNGEPVEASVAGRPMTQIFQNVEYLRQLVEEAQLGQSLKLTEQPCESSVVVGTPVYWDDANGRFAPALAKLNVSTSGNTEPDKQAQVWGVVVAKSSSTTADILLKGSTVIDLSPVVDTGTVVSGPYYLSTTEPGKLTASKPNIAIEVLKVGNIQGQQHTIIVDPDIPTLFSLHRHYKYSLVCLPAGSHTPPNSGNRHVITNPDNTQEGWLPVSDPIFSGKNIPTDAVFGYNIEVSPLKDLWPPIPVESAYLEWDRGKDKDLMGVAVPLGEDKLCVINEDGIWWMTDCYDDVPWPTNYDSANPPSPPPQGNECPRSLIMSMNLYFTKPIFTNSDTAVLSLTARQGSGLAVYCRGTNDVAETGHLELDLDFNTSQTDDNLLTDQAIKEVSGAEFKRGPVVVSIKSNSPTLSVTSNSGKTQNDGYFGEVVLEANLDPSLQDFPILDVRLNGVEQEFYQDLLGLGFPYDRNSEVRMRFRIPHGVSLTQNATASIVLWLLALESGNFPNNLLTCTYRVLSDPGTGLALPTTDSNLTLDTTWSGATANDYKKFETGTIPVAAGDVITFTLKRSAPDSYSGKVILLNAYGRLVTV